MIRYGRIPLEYHRTPDDSQVARVSVLNGQRGEPLPSRMLGNFIEHFGFSIYGGLWAQQLANPTFQRDANLPAQFINELLRAGRLMTEYYLSGFDPRVLPPNWSPWGDYSGFGVLALDNTASADTTHQLPFPWGAVGQPGCATPSNGRIGGAVRLWSTGWTVDHAPQRVDLDDGPAGIRQGVFLPLERVRDFHGDVWVRRFVDPSSSPDEAGVVEVGVRRRLGAPGRPAGERLDYATLPVRGAEWLNLSYRLHLTEDMVNPGEPVDLYLRWLPGSAAGAHLLVDRFSLYPNDAVEDLFDPEILRLAREWPVPLLRWPGGNFASTYHWQDGIGPADRRPTRKNEAWSGLEYNAIGTDEFIRLCRLIGAEPQITVNMATGSAQEAAAWVAYCNGGIDTPMGRLRASHGSPEPFHVRLWEVGNEIYGAWQAGYVGAEENAERFLAFAQAMRAVDPEIELIATGNPFDFATPGPGYDHTHADRRWHRALLERAAGEIDYISLHSLPANDLFLEHATPEAVFQALMGQVTSWERRFLPELLAQADAAGLESLAGEDRRPIGLAITEWAVLGMRKDRPWADTFGEAIYAGLFLNMMARNADRVPISNATGLLHGGCIRKVAGPAFVDSQYLVMQQYARLIGAQILPVRLEAPGHDVPLGADLGAPERDVPDVDIVAAWHPGPGSERGLYFTAVNQRLDQPIVLELSLADFPVYRVGDWVCISAPDVMTRATPAVPQPCLTAHNTVTAVEALVRVELPPCSVSLFWFGSEEAPAAV